MCASKQHGILTPRFVIHTFWFLSR